MAAVQSLSRYLPEKVTLSLDQSGILGQVQKVGQTVHMDKLHDFTAASLSATLPFYREGESHIKGLFAMPVGDGAAVLYVDTKYNWGFNDKQQKLIRDISQVLQELLQKHECLREQQHFSRILEFWRRTDEMAFQGHSLGELSNMLIIDCAQLLGAEYGFVAMKEAGKHDYRLLAATPNAPRNLTYQHFLVKHGLVGWIFQKKKPLLISRLNSHTSEHFLFTSQEALPHHGTFWGMHAQLSLGHAIAMSFLSRFPMEWSQAEQHSVSHVMNFYQLLLEQYFLAQEYSEIKTYDLSTGVYNSLAFEAGVEKVLNTSMQASTPFTLALIQIDPWHKLFTKISPKQVRMWQRDLAIGFCEAVPPGSMVGQIAENRFGFLFPDMPIQEAKHHITRLVDVGQEFLTNRLKGARLRSHIGCVSFPQDGTRSDELWPLVYQHLFTNSRTKIENSGT
jgi:GGDEF domain-containing protein